MVQGIFTANVRILFIAFFILLGTNAVKAGYSNKIQTKAKDPGLDLHAQTQLLQKELDRLYEVEKQGGWKKIKPGKKFYSKGESAATIKQIKQRLQASGDFTLADTTSKFNDELELTVKKIQRRFGLEENGVIDLSLIKQLNLSVDERIDQLLANIERLRAMPEPGTGTRLVANIPEFRLHVYEGSKHVFDMAIVVGTESNKTVTFNDEMKQIIFSPYWNVPPSIVQKEILPAMRRNKNYLRNNNYERIGTEDGLPVIRQKPGRTNSLGLVKFVFPNSHAIYFHDTPAKSLFQVRKRTFSHGCIRLAEPAKLAQYLLRNNSEWTTQKIEEAMNSGKEQGVNLQQPVAVAITYFTAWVDESGLLHLREDVYGHDKELAKKIAGR
jgi:murein L,D-transpeptidase YcbB/YkuD